MIELTDLTKQFTLGGEEILAVNHMDLKVEHGEFLSVVGPSGSGKSTLMNILGLLDAADSGTYLLDKKDVTLLSDDEQAEIRNQKIGFVFQSFYLLPKLNAMENIMVPLLYRGFDEKQAKEKALAALEHMRLLERKQHLPHQLSGGQQQRVAIARALAGEPALLLADEPTGALDSQTGREIMTLLKELNDGGQTIVLITHDKKVAHFAHRAVEIADGRIVNEEVMS